MENISKLPRLMLVMLAKLYPEIIDAKFSSFGEISKKQSGTDLKNLIAELEKEETSRVDEEKHLEYKYLISIDGNTCSWRRIPWIMLSNSVLLKQETDNIEWFYPALKANVHYIPIKQDLTDIFEQYKLLEVNEEKAKQVSANARNFVLDNLLPEHIEAYMVIILNKYHDTFHKNQKLSPSLKPVNEFLIPKTEMQKMKEKIFFWE